MPYELARKKYCSQRCLGIANVRKAAENHPTGIETETYSALAEMGIEFEPQAHIGWYLVDAYIPETRTIIECQGDFYHCNPVVFPNGPVCKTQETNLARDERRFAWMHRKGYTVVLLWERDILAEGARALLERALAPLFHPAHEEVQPHSDRHDGKDDQAA